MTGVVMVNKCGGSKEGDNENQHVSIIEFLLAAIRKSLISCRLEDERGDDALCPVVHRMEIGWPTNVQHVAHVTFDRFNGFLGLPVEFQVEIPCRAPSASVSVFGVSPESMQCSYDARGNSVPTILLLMQERLYSQEGLKAEGIFRINPENGQEEEVRKELNKGVVPQKIDVHCLAALIKAWLRELPCGVLDGLSPDEVLNCNTEDQIEQMVKKLKPTEFGLLNWAVELMADVVEEEHCNKMNARNIAMVFAPNMTQMADPLTALLHAVQVMNLLKTLITKTLRDRHSHRHRYSPLSSPCYVEHTDEDSPLGFEGYIPDTEDHDDADSFGELEDTFLTKSPNSHCNIDLPPSASASTVAEHHFQCQRTPFTALSS